ncbi:MAG: hypothetical protein CVU78_01350 [Elusimicrobia bacterium HGW-Elusimicrobia-2]|nr:MAG: hypothetical protein CVU78_01350 [Elusimicrobia bacterium HGW-Elusimicrobia-2]
MITVLLQLFAIGFMLNFAGPCAFVCSPLASLCAAGTSNNNKKGIIALLLFLSGRLAAALIYGVLAGISSGAIRTAPAVYGGVIEFLTAFFFIAAALLLFIGKSGFICRDSFLKNSGFFTGGFLIGLLPCPPFVAVFLEIALVSQSVTQAVFYGFSFGAGLFVSGFIVMASLTGVMGFSASAAADSVKVRKLLRILCALFLIFAAVKRIIP